MLHLLSTLALLDAVGEGGSSGTTLAQGRIIVR